MLFSVQSFPFYQLKLLRNGSDPFAAILWACPLAVLCSIPPVLYGIQKPPFLINPT